MLRRSVRPPFSCVLHVGNTLVAPVMPKSPLSDRNFQKHFL
jgi:hypothetical protein